MRPPLLEVQGLMKKFPPSTIALQDASLTVTGGEVHCLLGANGAGKSTLLKVIAGAHRADRGSIEFAGQPLHLRSPFDAAAAGITMIYQELDLIPEMTVAQNLFLGHAPSDMGLLRHKQRAAAARDALERLGARFSIHALVKDLSVADQQVTAIARSLTLDARLIIMDEPSAALNENELNRVFTIIRELTREGRSVLYVSHRLKEVLEIGSRATVLRNGITVALFDVASTTEHELAAAMVGQHRSLLERVPRQTEPEQPVLDVHLLEGQQGLQIKDVQVKHRQIVGLTGLNGAGRTAFLKSLFGLLPFRGDVRIDGKAFHPRSPQAAIKHGIGLVPENRKTEGLILDAALFKNATLPTLRGKRFTRRRQLVALSEQVLQALGAKFQSVFQPAGELSGGNQQKVVVSKWLLNKSRILLLDEPSRGLDIGAKADMYALIRNLADQGASVLVTSSELDELYVNCDEIWVLHEGKNVARFDPKIDDREAILHATITGTRGTGHA